MTKYGRPRKEIDKKDFEGLLAIQCTLDEIVAFFDVKLDGCSRDTIERWCKRTYHMPFADISKLKRNYGKIGLRRTQFQLAQKSAPMAIFLGKNYLGQSDNPAPDVSDEFIKKSNEQIRALADLINNPVEDVDIETLAKEAENEQHENEGAEQ